MFDAHGERAAAVTAETCCACGKRLHSHVKFCPFCGEAQRQQDELPETENRNIEQDKEEKNPSPIAHEVVQDPVAPINDTLASQETVDKEDDGYKQFIYFMIFLVLIVGGAGLFLSGVFDGIGRDEQNCKRATPPGKSFIVLFDDTVQLAMLDRDVLLQHVALLDTVLKDGDKLQLISVRHAAQGAPPDFSRCADGHADTALIGAFSAQLTALIDAAEPMAAVAPAQSALVKALTALFPAARHAQVEDRTLAIISDFGSVRPSPTSDESFAEEKQAMPGSAHMLRDVRVCLGFVSPIANEEQKSSLNQFWGEWLSHKEAMFLPCRPFTEYNRDIFEVHV